MDRLHFGRSCYSYSEHEWIWKITWCVDQCERFKQKKNPIWQFTEDGDESFRFVLMFKMGFAFNSSMKLSPHFWPNIRICWRENHWKTIFLIFSLNLWVEWNLEYYLFFCSSKEQSQPLSRLLLYKLIHFHQKNYIWMGNAQSHHLVTQWSISRPLSH